MTQLAETAKQRLLTRLGQWLPIHINNTYKTKSSKPLEVEVTVSDDCFVIAIKDLGTYDIREWSGVTDEDKHIKTLLDIVDIYIDNAACWRVRKYSKQVYCAYNPYRGNWTPDLLMHNSIVRMKPLKPWYKPQDARGFRYPPHNLKDFTRRVNGWKRTEKDQYGLELVQTNSKGRLDARYEEAWTVLFDISGYYYEACIDTLRKWLPAVLPKKTEARCIIARNKGERLRPATQNHKDLLSQDADQFFQNLAGISQQEQDVDPPAGMVDEPTARHWLADSSVSFFKKCRKQGMPHKYYKGQPYYNLTELSTWIEDTYK